GFAEKHPADRKTDPNVAAAVKEKASDGRISCIAAFDVSGELNVLPSQVGFTADALDIRITKCQLGLFGYRPKKKKVRPAETVSGDLEDTLRDARVNDRLPCISAWEIAERNNVDKTEISAACETLNIKISTCQLGAF
ncbi:MAG: hypothetical protein JRF27_05795, partial [Deltaproteobacteria bacterium]|nr:hypothetical protein [Deltaproteobacteria bacterium]